MLERWSDAGRDVQLPGGWPRRGRALGADTGARTGLQKHKGRLIKHQTLTESRAQNTLNARHVNALIGFNNIIHSLKNKHTLLHLRQEGECGTFLHRTEKPEEQLLF